MTLFFSCASLKNVQRKEQKEEVTVDNSLTELVRTEIEQQISSINQTVVEFYPQERVYSVDTVSTLPAQIAPKVKKSVDSVESVHTETPIRPKKPPNQQVKKITTTQIDIKSDKITQKDSVTVSDIVHTVDTDYTEETEEKPSNFVSSIKWIAITLGIILLIIIVIKFRKI
ncbi:MAG: hypothetical protein SNG81_04295 [Rikenellaceae bacterium]